MPTKSLKPWRRTWTKRTVRRALGVMASGGVLALCGTAWADRAAADIIVINPQPRPALDVRIPMPLLGWCPGGGAGSGFGGFCEGANFDDGTRLNYFGAMGFWQGPRCIRVDGTPNPPAAPGGCGGLG